MASASVVALGLVAGGLGTAPWATGAASGGEAPLLACHAMARATAEHSAPTAVGTAPAAVIRVDQVGYPSAAPKLAEIMTTSLRAGVGWELIRSNCTVVASGVTSRDLGSWSKRYPAVWAVPFSEVQRPGRYRLALTADPAVVSPWFRIGQPSRLYRAALANALSFYQNERDGPDFIRSGLRTAPGHLNDASAMTFRAPNVSPNGNFRGSLRPLATGVRINATGGWFDAGDYLKFTETTSYTVAIMLQGIAAFPDVLGRSGWRAEAKFGLDFLRRMWNERTRTLYLQVGTGEANNFFVADHDIWRLPQADDHYHGTDPRFRYIRHPPVFRAGRPGSRISPNLAGRLTADFALCYRVFRVSDPSYAASCLRSAQTVYSLAGTHWHGRLQTVLPYGFYPESSWRDDLMLGATELALAERSAGQRAPAAFYLRAAGRWARAWIASPASRQDTLNLYDVSALGYYELYRALGVFHARLAVTRATLLAALRAQIRRAISVGNGNPFRFGFAWDQFDTTTHGLGLSVMAAEYDALAGRPVYRAWGQRQLDDVLGANAWGVSLIVGDGTVFPDCMQHQVANLAGSLNGAPPVLAGAVVEGPNSFAATGIVTNMRLCVANALGGVPYHLFNGHKAVFADNVQSWSTVEPAIDLTALSPLAFAWQEAGFRALRAGF
jgi:endoglucanase